MSESSLCMTFLCARSEYNTPKNSAKTFTDTLNQFSLTLNHFSLHQLLPSLTLNHFSSVSPSLEYDIWFISVSINVKVLVYVYRTILYYTVFWQLQFTTYAGDTKKERNSHYKKTHVKETKSKSCKEQCSFMWSSKKKSCQTTQLLYSRYIQKRTVCFSSLSVYR